MFNDFVGKEVEITVAFAIGSQAASLPVVYQGKLLESNSEFCKVLIESGRAALNSGGYATSKAMSGIFGDMVSVDTTSSRGNMIIRNQYIVTILNKQD